MPNQSMIFNGLDSHLSSRKITKMSEKSNIFEPVGNV